MPAQARAAVFHHRAATGIGAAAARKLTERGYRVFAGVHTTPRAASAPEIETIRMDVADPDGIAAATVRERIGTGGLRAVVNNAGVIVQGPLELVPQSELERQFAINTLGPVEPVADAVVTAVEARRPRRRYSSRNGVRLFDALSHVPIGLRERLVASAFGLSRVATDVALDGR